MGAHIDAPGMGLFGATDFGGGMLAAALEEAEAKDAAFDSKGEGGAIATIVNQPPPAASAAAAAAAAAVPDAPLPGATMPGAVGPSPGPPGGRPPGYAVGTQAVGSASRGAMSLLASVGVAAAAGYLTKDPKVAAAGFLATGSALNLAHGQAASASPDPAARVDATWSTAASLVGLGLAAYLGYSHYKDRK
jgi:hypothetical protein